jgi:serine phosphatase RsbU (regulator of sigma subunit)
MRTIAKLNGHQTTTWLWPYHEIDGLCEAFEERIKERTIELEEKNNAMIHSLQYASRLQNAMLPSRRLFERYFSDYFILNRPKEIVSGDFYWVNKVNGKMIFTIADCTGHGVPGAFISILGIMLLEQITGRDKVVEADEILNILRDRMNMAINRKKNREEVKDGLDLTLCVFDTEENTLQFSGALDRIYRVRNNSLDKIRPDQMPWNSHMDCDTPCEKHEINVQPGDVFYLFTDGYPDQFGGEKNKKFTLKRFQELLMKICHKKMNKQKQILDDTITEWQGPMEQIDDITVMGIRF